MMARCIFYRSIIAVRFIPSLFDWKSPLSETRTAEISRAKDLIYDGAALAGDLPKELTGILVDEQFGGAILHDASSKNIITACPAEKSGQADFDFEYDEDFACHIEAFNPTFCKVLVRYTPRGDLAQIAPARDITPQKEA
jgi:myo-inositol catabolism protein IolC